MSPTINTKLYNNFLTIMTINKNYLNISLVYFCHENIARSVTDYFFADATN